MLFGEPGGFLEGWINLIAVGIITLTVIWLFFIIIDTKAGRKVKKTVNKASSPILYWYENLPFNLRNVVGWLAITFYCLGIIALFIFLEG